MKREAEEAGGVVRIMTVHGAKGLQAPLVILPDTTSLPARWRWAGVDRGRFAALVAPQGIALRGGRCEPAAAKQARMEEYNRLLYVALTRAEDRLVVCGWETRPARARESWYAIVARGMDRLATRSEALDHVEDSWEGRCWCTAASSAPPRVPTRPGNPSLRLACRAGSGWRPTGALPRRRPSRRGPRRWRRAARRKRISAWCRRPPSPLAARGGDALARGTLIHRLLQHMPDMAPETREAAVRAHVARAGGPDVADEVLAVLPHPELAPLFGPDGRAEVPLTGLVDGGGGGGPGGPAGGAARPGADRRLQDEPHRAGRARDTPVLYLRQMAAYRAILRGCSRTGRWAASWCGRGPRA